MKEYYLKLICTRRKGLNWRAKRKKPRTTTNSQGKKSTAKLEFNRKEAVWLFLVFKV